MLMHGALSLSYNSENIKTNRNYKLHFYFLKRSRMLVYAIIIISFYLLLTVLSYFSFVMSNVVTGVKFLSILILPLYTLDISNLLYQPIVTNACDLYQFSVKHRVTMGPWVMTDWTKHEVG